MRLGRDPIGTFYQWHGIKYYFIDYDSQVNAYLNMNNSAPPGSPPGALQVKPDNFNLSNHIIHLYYLALLNN